MTRILADLPDEEIKRLDQLAYEQGKSRAAILREAVAAYRPQGSLDWLEAGFVDAALGSRLCRSSGRISGAVR
jgi:predicted transcriptional regulator